MTRRCVVRAGRRQFLRGSLALAGLGLLAGCAGLPPQARQAARTPHIGELWSRVYEPLPPRYPAFLEGLRDLGWVEGQHVAFERRYAEDRAERFPELAAELVRLQVDVLIGFSGSHIARRSSNELVF